MLNALLHCKLLTGPSRLAQVEVEVTLRHSVSQSVCLDIEHPCGTCDQILLVQGQSYFTTDSQSVSQYVLVSSTLVGLATRYYLSKVEVTLRLPISQSVSMSWYRAPLWHLRPDVTCPRSKLLYDWQSVSQSVCLGIEHPCGTCDRILLVQGRSYLRLTVSQPVCHGIEHPCGTCDQILLPVGMLLSEICGLVSIGRPLWREDGSSICSVVTQWSESPSTEASSTYISVDVLRRTQL
jgi:hypothetical protein